MHQQRLRKRCKSFKLYKHAVPCLLRKRLRLFLRSAAVALPDLPWLKGPPVLTESSVNSRSSPTNLSWSTFTCIHLNFWIAWSYGVAAELALECFSVFVQQSKYPWCRRAMMETSSSLGGNSTFAQALHDVDMCNDGHSIMCWWKFYFASKLKWDSTNRKFFNVFVKQPKCPWCRRVMMEIPSCCWWNFTRFTSTVWKCHNDNASMYKLSGTITCTMAVSQKIWT